MSALSLSTALAEDQRSTATYAAALLLALAREEAADRRPPRLTERDLATWKQFRGRLTSTNFVELLFEDAAVAHPIPFDPQRLEPTLTLAQLSPEAVDALLTQINDVDLADDSAEYVAAQADLLGLPTRLGRSELPVVKPHHKVLELPGTGGQLAHHIVTTSDGLSLHQNTSIACATWQELTLAGIVALDRGAPHSDFITRAAAADLRDSAHPLRRQRFDFVVGLHPEKGGALRMQDELAIWFSSARVCLV